MSLTPLVTVFSNIDIKFKQYQTLNSEKTANIQTVMLRMKYVPLSNAHKTRYCILILLLHSKSFFLLQV